MTPFDGFAPALEQVEVPRARRAPVRLRLTDADREELSALMRRGRASARIFKRARVLQLLDLGKPPAVVTEALGVSYALVQRVGLRYAAEGLAAALGERPRPGATRRLGAEAERQLLSLLEEPPPSGRARWSVRTLTAEALRRGISARLGRETVRELLLRRNRAPWPGRGPA